MIGSRSGWASRRPFGFPLVPSFDPSAMSASQFVSGGLLDPLAPREPVVRGGLLDPTGWRDLQEEGLASSRIRRRELPAMLRALPLGPEGGLLGAMLAQYVEPDEERTSPSPQPAPVPADAAASSTGAFVREPAPTSSGPEAGLPWPLSAIGPVARFVGAKVDKALSGPWPAELQERMAERFRASPVLQDAYRTAREDIGVVRLPGGVSARRPVDTGPAMRARYASDWEKMTLEEQADRWQAKLDPIEEQFRALADLSRAAGWTETADNVDRFLAGAGGTKEFDPAWLRSFPEVRRAEGRVQGHFADWMTGGLIPGEASERVKQDLMNLKDGQSFTRSSKWDGHFYKDEESQWTPELYLAFGRSEIVGKGDFTFERTGDVIHFRGEVVHEIKDRFDWEKGGHVLFPGFLDHDDALTLEKYRDARPFLMHSEWRQTVEGTLVQGEKNPILTSIRWRDAD